jgi:hypothetical protein
VIGVILAALATLVVVVVVQTRRGKLADRCCCPADPSLDLRMGGAFEEGATCSQPSRGPRD